MLGIQDQSYLAVNYGLSLLSKSSRLICTTSKSFKMVSKASVRDIVQFGHWDGPV